MTRRLNICSNCGYFAKTDDVEAMSRMWQPGIANLFGLFRPNVNAPAEGQSFNPLAVAAIYGSEKVTEFLLDNGVDRAAIPLALRKAKQFGHREVLRLLTAHS